MQNSHQCSSQIVQSLHITECATCKAACGPEIWRDSSVILGEERLDENLAAASVQHVWVHWARVQSAGCRYGRGTFAAPVCSCFWRRLQSGRAGRAGGGSLDEYLFPFEELLLLHLSCTVIMLCSLQSVEQCEAHSKASSVENAKNATYSICLSTLAVASSAMYRMFFF